jgi:transcriptional regulator with XRE-family HTH domain
MSLDELARKCGYTSDNARSSIQKIESGKSDVPASKICLIAEALNIPIGELMGYFDKFDSQYDTHKISKEVELVELITELHGKTVCEALNLFVKLDSIDQEKVIERMDTMLEADKYTIEVAARGNSKDKIIATPEQIKQDFKKPMDFKD